MNREGEKKNEEKWMEPQKKVGTIKPTNTLTDGNTSRRGERRENIFKEIMTEHFTNLLKKNNPYIQGAKWTLSKKTQTNTLQ